MERKKVTVTRPAVGNKVSVHGKLRRDNVTLYIRNGLQKGHYEVTLALSEPYCSFTCMFEMSQSQVDGLPAAMFESFEMEEYDPNTL